MDASIRVWDLPTASLVDLFFLPSLPTSVAFSPKADFLATTHVDQVGIFLWANRLQFSSIPLVPIHPDAQGTLMLELPGTNGVDDDDNDTSNDTFFVQNPADVIRPTSSSSAVVVYDAKKSNTSK